MERFGWNLGSHIPPCPRHVRHDAVAMATPLPSNGALHIQQLYRRLVAERENQFRWYFVHNSKLGPKSQSYDQILNFFKFKMADGRNGGRPPCWKIFEILYLAYQWTNWDPTWMVTSHHLPDMSLTIRLPWQRPLPSNGALNILQLWESGGQTREPILMKFGTQQYVSTTMTVTWSNIKIFKIQNGKRPPCWKIFEMP